MSPEGTGRLYTLAFLSVCLVVTQGFEIESDYRILPNQEQTAEDYRIINNLSRLYKAPSRKSDETYGVDTAPLNVRTQYPSNIPIDSPRGGDPVSYQASRSIGHESPSYEAYPHRAIPSLFRKNSLRRHQLEYNGSPMRQEDSYKNEDRRAVMSSLFRKGVPFLFRRSGSAVDDTGEPEVSSSNKNYRTNDIPDLHLMNNM